jgi:hypothetical protein
MKWHDPYQFFAIRKFKEADEILVTERDKGSIKNRKDCDRAVQSLSGRRRPHQVEHLKRGECASDCKADIPLI